MGGLAPLERSGGILPPALQVYAKLILAPAWGPLRFDHFFVFVRMGDEQGLDGRSKRARRPAQLALGAGSSSRDGAGDRPTSAERERALASIDAMKKADVEPSLLARTVAAEKCVRMVAAAHAWRCGERFDNPSAAMQAFGALSTAFAAVQVNG